MAAAVTAGVSATTTTDNAALTTGSFTPAANDLLVAFVCVTGRLGGVVTDSLGGSWVQVSSANKNTNADVLLCLIRDTFVSGLAMTVTFTPDASISTGIAISVLRVSGITRNPAEVALQEAHQQNQAGSTTPEPVFGAACLTGNPTVGAVATSASAEIITPPTGWTERHEISIITPGMTLETVSRDSGFTGDTVTWGNNPTGDFCDIVVELDASVPIAVAPVPAVCVQVCRESQFSE